MVIALTGKKLAGKGTIASYLHSNYSAELFRFSKPLSDILARLHRDNSRENLVALATKLREAFSDDILADTLLADVEKSDSPLKVIDGMRYMAEYEALKDQPGFLLVYIDADVTTRYERTKQRIEKTDEANMSFEEFQGREHDATEVQIEELKQLADHVVPNMDSFEQFYTDFCQAVNLPTPTR